MRVGALLLEAEADAEAQLVERRLLHGDDQIGDVGMSVGVRELDAHRREGAEVVDLPARVFDVGWPVGGAGADSGVQRDETRAHAHGAVDAYRSVGGVRAERGREREARERRRAIDLDDAVDLGPRVAERLQRYFERALLGHEDVVIVDGAPLDAALQRLDQLIALFAERLEPAHLHGIDVCRDAFVDGEGHVDGSRLLGAAAVRRHLRAAHLARK